MKQQDFIRITKLESLNEFSKNNDHTQTVLDDQWFCEGFLGNDIKLGEQIDLFRIANYNYPTGRLGSFNTSIVEKIEPVDDKNCIIHTL